MKTAYIFTGQGSQKQGMGMTGYERSAGAKDVWDRADALCRKELGFSLLEIVRDNPKSISVNGNMMSHPEGVLNLTQFTQVAIVTLALASTAELKERNLHDDNALFAGHSLGEYAAISAIVPLEKMIKITYHRGLTMQNYVPRDEKGNSPYRMIVVRPNIIGLTDGDLANVVDSIAKQSNGVLQIVNFNIRDEQYAITGEIPLLEQLKKFLNEQGEKVGMKKKSYLELPGIDVPFHSVALRPGVDVFRKTLEGIMSEELDYRDLEGRYIPNLNGCPFTLSRDYIERVYNNTQSPVLKDVLENGVFDSKEVAHKLFIELLAYQFASPVQWIKTQEFLLGDEGVDRVIEIGPAPVLANMARITLEKMGRNREILHIEKDRPKIFGEGI